MCGKKPNVAVARKRGHRLNFSGHAEKLEMLSFTVRSRFPWRVPSLTDSKPNCGNRHIHSNILKPTIV